MRVNAIAPQVPAWLRPYFPKLWDGLAWPIAVPTALLLRYDASLPSGSIQATIVFGLVLGLLQVALSVVVERFRGRYVIGSLDEVALLAALVFGVSLVGTVLVMAGVPEGLPRSVPFIAGLVALTIMMAGRFMVRSSRRRRVMRSDGHQTIVYGAGEAGEQIVRQMLSQPSPAYRPVAFLDDNPAKHHMNVSGVRVVGSIDSLVQLVDKGRCDVLVVAIASINGDKLRELDAQCEMLGIQLRVVPTTAQILGGSVRLDDLSHVVEEDLLGRKPVATDESAIRTMLQGKRVIITGAGGSIGSELARQISRYEPEFLGLLDRDESALQQLQLSLDGRGLLHTENLLLADIRDKEALLSIFGHARPTVVFHAAALKHLTLLERFPDEGFKTNVVGTSNVLDAAGAAGVEVFINVSTDKAAEPSSVLGRTKRATEELVSSAGEEIPREHRYISVRFGNVLGSRGSAIPTFRRQIAGGGPVTITHPEVRRFFMTISEAVHLLLNAAAIGGDGDVLVLEMGNPVKMIDVAREMIRRSGRDIAIEITGLRPGEKLEEVLIGMDETWSPTTHQWIRCIRRQGPPSQ